MSKHLVFLLQALALFSTAASQACGGFVTGVSMNIDAADRVPYSANKNVVVSFTTQTALALGDGVTINYPNHFFAAGTRLGLNQATSDTFLTCCNPPTITTVSYLNSYIVLTVGPKGAAAASYTVTLTGVIMGAPTVGNPTGISVSTTNDIISAGAPSGALGGRVQSVSMIIDVADRIPKATNKPVTGLGLMCNFYLCASDESLQFRSRPRPSCLPTTKSSSATPQTFCKPELCLLCCSRIRCSFCPDKQHRAVSSSPSTPHIFLSRLVLIPLFSMASPWATFSLWRPTRSQWRLARTSSAMHLLPSEVSSRVFP
jgi:hypothetical protein